VFGQSVGSATPVSVATEDQAGSVPAFAALPDVLSLPVEATASQDGELLDEDGLLGLVAGQGVDLAEADPTIWSIGTRPSGR
jgi:hypothetical protein